MSKLYEALKKIEKRKKKKEERNKNIPYIVHHRTVERWIGGIIVFMIAFVVVGFILMRLPEKRKVASISSTGVKLVQQKKAEKVVESPVKLEVIKTPPKQISKVERSIPVKEVESVETSPKEVKEIVLLPKTSVGKISKVEKSASLKKGKKVERVTEGPKKSVKKKRVSTYDITLLTLKAQRAAEKGEIEKAIDIYKKLLSVRKRDVRLMNNLGALYAMEGRYKSAQTVLKRAYNICTDVDIALNYTNVLYKMENKKAAQIVFKRINSSVLKTEEQKQNYEILKYLLAD
ncbi:MAG: tetratricopeptide repeat protein [Deltaproteobacteria bacterium]|nr:tetratricopeptide repeat protein [Deltaproteobacteria bacterium]